MQKVLLLLALFTVSEAWSQKKVTPQTFGNSITEEDLKKQLYTIAGPAMEGRETATEGQRKAAAYIEEQFRSLGLLPGNKGSYQMQFPVYRDSILGCRISVNDQQYVLNQDFQPALQINYSATQYFLDVVLVGHGIVDSAYDDYGDEDVKGKLVIILDGAPDEYKKGKKNYFNATNNFAKIINARDKGAAAILLVSANFPRRGSSALGNMYVDLYKDSYLPNTYSISEKMAEAIMGDDWKILKEKSRKEKVNAKTYPVKTMLELNKTVIYLQSSNVMGYIEGADKKDEWLIITAHYDHLGKRDTVIYYGADDDGSGTVSVLEMAEAFTKAKAAGKGPRRSILFMTVSGEEKGLWGSEYYADHPVYPLEKTTANLNIDMIGRIDTERKKADTANYVYVVGDDKLSTDLKPISEEVNKKYVKLVLDYKYNDPEDPNRIYYRSDHFNFARKGVPIIFYYDGMLKADYHRPTDTPEKINYNLLKKRAQLVFYTAWEMANRDAMLKRDIPLQIPERF